MPQWFTDLTKSQWWAATRHYITFGIGILAGLGIVTVAQQHDILLALGNISDGVMKVVAGVGTLLTIAAPIINGWKAAHKASPAENIKTVAAIANDPAQATAPEAKVALLSATASMPELKGDINLNDKQLAAAVPSDKVVAK